MSGVYVKDPEAVLAYGHDWSEWLAAVEDTLASSDWTVPDGITVDTHTNDTTTTTVWLSGGTAGEWYRVSNHVVTAGGREDDRSLWILCAER